MTVTGQDHGKVNLFMSSNPQTDWDSLFYILSVNW